MTNSKQICKCGKTIEEHVSEIYCNAFIVDGEKFELAEPEENQSPRGVGTTMNVSERVENTQSGLRNHPDTSKSDEETQPLSEKSFDIKGYIDEPKVDCSGQYLYTNDVREAVLKLKKEIESGRNTDKKWETDEWFIAENNMINLHLRFIDEIFGAELTEKKKMTPKTQNHSDLTNPTLDVVSRIDGHNCQDGSGVSFKLNGTKEETELKTSLPDTQTQNICECGHEKWKHDVFSNGKVFSCIGCPCKKYKPRLAKGDGK